MNGEISIALPKVGISEAQSVFNVIKSKKLAQGEKVKEFEEMFAKYMGVKHAIAVNNGTSALHCAYLACDIKEGDEVITTPFTFIATINMIKACGAKPVFIDIKDDFNIDENLIEKAITQKTKAIVPVHLFGKPCNMDKIIELANKYGLSIIEDCAQSCGSEYHGKKVGSIGNAGTFSFYATKNLVTGEGGMVTTNDDKIAEKIRMIRNHGMDNKGNFKMFGYNYRMTDISASIGIEQLKDLDYNIGMRKYTAETYNYFFDKIIDTPKEEKNTKHSYNNYSFTVKNRDLVLKNLQANGIGARVYYEHPFADLPNTTKIAKSIISIPLRPNLTTDDVNHIIFNVQETLSGNKK